MRYRLLIASCAAVSLSAVSPPSARADCADYGASIHLEGTLAAERATDVAVQEPYLYFTEAPYGLRIAHLSGSAVPDVIGGVSIPGSSSRLTVQGTRAFVLTWAPEHDWTLHVVSVANPAVPWHMGAIGLYGDITGMAASGSHVYIANLFHGLQVIDVSNPAAPELVATLALYPRPTGIELANGYAYCSCGEGGLVVVDVRDPDTPVVAAALPLPAYIDDLAIEGTRAYLCEAFYPPDYTGGMRVVDIENAEAPIPLGRVELSGYAQSIEVQGDIAVLTVSAVTSPHAEIVDVSDPMAPSHIADLNLPAPGGHAMHDLRAYVCDSWRGLHVYDLSNPTVVPPLGGLEFTRANRVALHGTLALVTGTGDPALRVIDLNDTGAPEEVGTLWATEFRSIAAQGTEAFAASQEPSVWKIDIADPAAPLATGSLDLPVTPNTLVPAGGLLYVSDGDVRVIDTQSMTQVGFCATPGGSRALEVRGRYGYLLDTPRTLRVLDLEEPASPILLTYLLLPEPVEDMVVLGNHAYIGMADDGLAVVDLTEPVAPALLGVFSTPWGAFEVEGSGQTIYVSDTRHGAQVGALVMDVSDAGVPVPVGQVNHRSMDSDTDGNLFVALSNLGLAIYPVQCEGTSSVDAHAPCIEEFPVEARGSRIRIVVPGAGTARLSVLDVAGRHVRSLLDAHVAAPLTREITWDGDDDTGRRVAAGVYFLRLQFGARHWAARTLLLPR